MRVVIDEHRRYHRRVAGSHGSRRRHFRTDLSQCAGRAVPRHHRRHTVVARAGHDGSPRPHRVPIVVAHGGPADLPNDAASFTSALPVKFTDLSPDTLPPQLEVNPIGQLQPRIVTGPGARRTAFERVDGLQRPGVYVLLRDRDTYVGYGAEVGFRIIDGRQMPGGTPDRVIAIADAQNRLSTDDAKALERILWSSVAADDDFVLVNGEPEVAAGQ